MNKLIFYITIIFLLNACSHKVTYKTCAGPSNPQQEYHSLNSFIGSIFPPAVLLTTPFFLLQTQKNMNFADNETVRQQGVNDSNINKVLELVFLMLVVWIILFLFIIGHTRLFKMFKDVNQYIQEYIGIFVVGNQGEQELDQIEVVRTPPPSPGNNLTYRTPPRDSSNYDD